MKVYDVIIFDLDGVIIDQSTGITDSVKYSLKKFGIDESDNKKLLSFIGPPLKDSFIKLYSFDEKKALEAVGYFREMYEKKGIHEFKIYDGIITMLSSLRNKGKKLFIATTKPKKSAEIVLKEGKIFSYFEGIHGDTFSYDITKTGMISEILDNIQKHEYHKVVMVGDRDSDIDAAAKNKIDSIGVTYGFGSVNELENAFATHIVKSVEELKLILER